uniref:Uncharacterized protein LOC111138160 n=1 Tax=Crassostrea virginica TaxID=6565 RepID=A0A8B8F0E3_CRAVI|nr:uncharacterized protein LOC111138160 [Crassostrea virginica]
MYTCPNFRHFFVIIILTVFTRFFYVNGLMLCPTMDKWHQRAEVFCKNSNIYMYHCLPTIFLNESTEMCLKDIKIEEGYCAVYNTHLRQVSYDRKTNCAGNKNFAGCPEKQYRSNETFRYPSCQEINPVETCYLADLNCPDIDRSSGSGRSGVNNAGQLTWIFPILFAHILCHFKLNP